MVVWLQEAMRRAGLVWEHGPNVSVNANSSDSHYEPTAAAAKPIRDGDFVLIDIWARMDRPGSCFYDITWTGVVGREPGEREQEVFAVVTRLAMPRSRWSRRLFAKTGHWPGGKPTMRRAE